MNTEQEKKHLIFLYKQAISKYIQKLKQIFAKPKPFEWGPYSDQFNSDNLSVLWVRVKS